MKVIFLDDRIKNLRPIAKKLRKTFPDNFKVCIAMFGMEEKNAHSQYGHERIGILNYDVVNIPGAPENGIAIQEWINRHWVKDSVSFICIVSEHSDLRPLNDYIVRPGIFGISIRKVNEMLNQPYKNKMADMIESGYRRKHF